MNAYKRYVESYEGDQDLAAEITAAISILVRKKIFEKSAK